MCGVGAQIPVGEPHVPVGIATRGKATICPQAIIDDGMASAGDHDFNCVNFAPSLNLIVDIKAPSSTSDVSEILQRFFKNLYVFVLMLAVFYCQRQALESFLCPS